MGESAFEALYTGVYIFIFIAALTITLYLFRGVNELAENSYEYGVKNTSESLIEDVEEQERLLTASDVISYYYNYVDYDVTDNKNVYVDIYDRNNIKISAGKSYESLKNALGNLKYRITCNRIDTNGEYYFEIRHT